MKHVLKELLHIRYEIYESIRIAIEQVMQHKVRAALTALGVMIGVLAVSLMGTAVAGIDKGFNDSLSMIGKDVFYVERWPWGDPGRNWRLYAKRPMLREEYARRVNEIISETPHSTLEMAVAREDRHRSVRYGSNSIESTNIVGTDSTYINVTSLEISDGRFLSEIEASSGTRVVVLGADVSKALFPDVSPLGQRVIIQNQPFEIIGVLARQGSFLGLFSMDDMAVVPQKATPSAKWDHRDVTIMIKMREGANKEAAKSEIEGVMRRVRSLNPEDTDDFEVNSTDIMEKELGPVKKGVTLAGIFITGLSLFVGAIGIMNITFVAVRERTKEIGTRRAIGAPRRAILTQFLVEAVFICLIGGLVGLGLTVIIQHLAKNIMPAFPLVFSANLLVVAIVASVLTGVFSGFAPAWTASRMDPAEALRHD
jgi:putative ABC transport system permease protein